MSKYTYKRDDTPDVSGCGFVLFLFLALHGFCMYCLKDVSSTQQIHRARSKRRLFRSWNTHINWHNGHKKGGLARLLLEVWRNVTDRGVRSVWVHVWHNDGRVTWMTSRERFLNVSVFSSMLLVFEEACSFWHCNCFGCISYLFSMVLREILCNGDFSLIFQACAYNIWFHRNHIKNQNPLARVWH